MPPEYFPALVPFALGVFALQGFLMAVDEFWFHRRRDLPRWERLGHPLDTLTVLIPIFLAVRFPFAAPWAPAFVALALFSCVFVTKDEWVHARYSPPAEQWIHALLFILHPLLLMAVFLLWRAGHTGWLVAQTCVVTAFLTWQILYWNGPWAPSLRNTR